MFEISDMNPNGLQKEFQVKVPKKVIFSRPCVAGESQTKAGTCKPCEQNTYLLLPPTNVTACKPCLESAWCYGHNRIAPRQGNFRKDAASEP